jgi:hypothetical protein
MAAKYVKKILESCTKGKNPIRGKVFHEIYRVLVTPAQKLVPDLLNP